MDDNLCRINSVKPDKCRTFPYEWVNSDSVSVCPALADVMTPNFDRFDIEAPNVL